MRLGAVGCALAALALGLAGCGPGVAGGDGPAEAQAAELRAVARAALKRLQPYSVAQDREHCGMILRRADGALTVTPAAAGTEDSCVIAYDVRPGEVAVASFHTHAAYAPGYDNELPSVQDVTSDMAFGVDGFVATPAGRLWHIDGATGDVTLVCGPRCLPWDPDAPALRGLAARYDLAKLRRVLGP